MLFTDPLCNAFLIVAKKWTHVAQFNTKIERIESIHKFDILHFAVSKNIENSNTYGVALDPRIIGLGGQNVRILNKK